MAHPDQPPEPGLPAVGDHNHAEGVRAFLAEDYVGARRRFQALLASVGEAPPILAACGHCYFHEGEGGRAREFYLRAVDAAVGPPPPDAAYNLARLAVRLGDFAAARHLLNPLRAAPPEILPGRFYLGLLFSNTAAFLGEVCLYLGLAARGEGDGAGAVANFRRALEHDPAAVAPRRHLADIALANDHFLEAIAHLDELLRQSTVEEERLEALNALGIACYRNGMLQEAIGHLARALQQRPGDPTAVSNLNYIYEREGILERERAPGTLMRFTDRHEDAQPIFQLAGAEDIAIGGPVIIGRSQAMLRVMRHARVAAASDAPVLLVGEAGSGKELLAETIAVNSSRADAAFSVVTCGAIPEVLLESELFGHEKGAFTGARTARAGVLESAAGGTVFLDEVTALSPRLQGRLLRVLRDQSFEPMGGSRVVPLDIRLIAATTRPPKDSIAHGALREDLFYALNVVPIEVPPLRERREDIPLLVDYFLHKYARPLSKAAPFGEDDLELLKEHDWPGNVRELENLVQRAAVMGSQSSVFLEGMARLRREAGKSREDAPDDPVAYPPDISLAELEQRHIMAVLRRCGHNQRKAAKLLGINPSTLWRKLKSRGHDKG